MTLSVFARRRLLPSQPVSIPPRSPEPAAAVARCAIRLAVILVIPRPDPPGSGPARVETTRFTWAATTRPTATSRRVPARHPRARTSVKVPPFDGAHGRPLPPGPPTPRSSIASCAPTASRPASVAMRRCGARQVSPRPRGNRVDDRQAARPEKLFVAANGKGPAAKAGPLNLTAADGGIRCVLSSTPVGGSSALRSGDQHAPFGPISQAGTSDVDDLDER